MESDDKTIVLQGVDRVSRWGIESFTHRVHIGAVLDGVVGVSVPCIEGVGGHGWEHCITYNCSILYILSKRCLVDAIPQKDSGLIAR